MPRSNSLILNTDSSFWTQRWPQLPTPGPNQLRSLTKLIPSKVPPFPVGASTERAAGNTFNKCPGFGMDAISNLPRKYPTIYLANKIIGLLQSQQSHSIGSRHWLNKHLLSTHYAHVSGAGLEHGCGQTGGN